MTTASLSTDERAMKATTQLRASDYIAVFRSLPSAAMLLALDLRVVDVNPALLDAVNRDRDDVVGRYVFDAFPANPHYPEGDGVANWHASLRRVLESRRAHTMGVQRYDVPWPGAAEGFAEKYWYPSNTPIIDAGGELIGILHTVEDLTGLHEDFAAEREFYHQEIRAQCDGDEAMQLRFADYAKVAIRNARHYPGVVAEVEHLREALTSRATIDQAKGILMVENRCGPEEAFELLVRMSQTRNVKLRRIATDLVAQAATRGERSPAGDARFDGKPSQRSVSTFTQQHPPNAHTPQRDTP